jgi:hypothetical protein
MTRRNYVHGKRYQRKRRFAFVAEVLFRRFLFLGEREALRLFPASCAFLSVVSALAVSHIASTLTLLWRRSKLAGGFFADE